MSDIVFAPCIKDLKIVVVLDILWLKFLLKLQFTVETDRISFSAPKMTIFDGFGHFRLRPHICPKTPKFK